MGKRAEVEIDEAPTKKSKKVKALVETVAEEEAEDPEEKRKRKEEKKKRKQAAAEALAAAEEPAEEQAPKKKQKKEAVAEEEEEKAETGAETEIFVGGLPFSCTEDALRTYFSKCGEVQSLKLPAGKGTKKHSRGIAFVTFTDKEGVRKALKRNGKEFDGRTLRVSNGPRPEKEVKEGEVKSNKGSGKAKSKGSNALRVFVGGLPFQAGEDVLRKDFGECGEIEAFTMPLNDEGKPRGIAFISYRTQAGVDKALAFEGTVYGGRTLTVSKAVEGKGKGKDGKGKAKGKGKDNAEEVPAREPRVRARDK